MNEGKSGVEAEWLTDFAALCSLQSTRKLVAEKRRDTYNSNTNEREKWIQGYVHTGMTVKRKEDEDRETAIWQQQEDV